MDDVDLLHEGYLDEYKEDWLKNKIKSKLYDHQKIFIAWGLYRENYRKSGCKGGFIFDEPGLGKSLSLLSLILTHPVERSTLIIVPTHLIQHWKNEINLHFHEDLFDCMVYYGKDRYITPISEKQQIIFTSYGTLRNDFANGIMECVKHRFPIEQYPIAFPGFRKDSIFDRYFGRLIFDESHNFRNNTKTARAIRSLYADIVWCITATPIMNKIDDLFNQVSILGISPFDSKETWKQCVSLPMRNRPITTFDMILRNMIRPFSIRRVKKNLNLPPRNEETVWLTYSEEEEKLYGLLLDYTRTRVDKIFLNIRKMQNKKMKKFVNRMRCCIGIFILRLRQCCCHPELVIKKILKEIIHKKVDIDLKNLENIMELLKKEIESGLKEECSICLSNKANYSNGICSHLLCQKCSEDLINYNYFNCPLCRQPFTKWIKADESLNEMEDTYELATIKEEEKQEIKFSPLLSSKIKWIDTQLKTHNDKVLIVSQWIEYLKIIERYLINEQITFIWLDGKTPAIKRHQIVKEFQTNPGIRICLLSLNASSEGINLTSACRVIHVDIWWNKSKALQASDRVHRLGQTKEVFITHLLIRDTVEEAMIKMQEQKMQVCKVIQGLIKPTSEMIWSNEVKLLLGQRECEAYQKLKKRRINF